MIFYLHLFVLKDFFLLYIVKSCNIFGMNAEENCLSLSLDTTLPILIDKAQGCLASMLPCLRHDSIWQRGKCGIVGLTKVKWDDTILSINILL